MPGTLTLMLDLLILLHSQSLLDEGHKVLEGVIVLITRGGPEARGERLGAGFISTRLMLPHALADALIKARRDVAVQ